MLPSLVIITIYTAKSDVITNRILFQYRGVKKKLIVFVTFNRRFPKLLKLLLIVSLYDYEYDQLPLIYFLGWTNSCMKIVRVTVMK